MAASQRPLDLGCRDHFTLLHGGHRHRVAVATIDSEREKAWQEKTYDHDAAEAIVAGLVDDVFADLLLSQNGFRAWRNTRNVAALTSCYVDLDYYRNPAFSGMSPEELLDCAMRAAPWLPIPTLLASSGRGAYFVWVFDKPLQPDALPRWQTVETALVSLLTPFGADQAAKDATRVLRVAGSVHVKTGNRVYYRHIADPVRFSELESKVREHCLRPPPRRKQTEEPSQPTVRAPAKGGTVSPLWNGYTLAHARRQCLEELARMRGPLTDYRARFLYLYSVAAAWYCSTPEDLVRDLDDFAGDYFVDAHRYQGAKQCKSVLDRVAQSKRGLKVAWQGEGIDPRYRMQNRTIVKQLDITPAELRALPIALSTAEEARRREDRERKRHPLTRGQYHQDQALERARKREEALELLNRGYTVAGVAEALGVTRMTVYNRLKAGGCIA